MQLLLGQSVNCCPFGPGQGQHRARGQLTAGLGEVHLHLAALAGGEGEQPLAHHPAGGGVDGLLAQAGVAHNVPLKAAIAGEGEGVKDDQFAVGQAHPQGKAMVKLIGLLINAVVFRQRLAGGKFHGGSPFVIYRLQLNQNRHGSGKQGPMSPLTGYTKSEFILKRAQAPIIGPISYFVKPDLSSDKKKKLLGKKRRISGETAVHFCYNEIATGKTAWAKPPRPPPEPAGPWPGPQERTSPWPLSVLMLC